MDGCMDGCMESAEKMEVQYRWMHEWTTKTDYSRQQIGRLKRLDYVDQSRLGQIICRWQLELWAAVHGLMVCTWGCYSWYLWVSWQAADSIDMRLPKDESAGLVSWLAEKSVQFRLESLLLSSPGQGLKDVYRNDSRDLGLTGKKMTQTGIDPLIYMKLMRSSSNLCSVQVSHQFSKSVTPSVSRSNGLPSCVTKLSLLGHISPCSFGI